MESHVNREPAELAQASRGAAWRFATLDVLDLFPILMTTSRLSLRSSMSRDAG